MVLGLVYLQDIFFDKYVNPIRLGIAMDTVSEFDLSEYNAFIRFGYVSSMGGRPPRIYDNVSAGDMYFCTVQQKIYAYNAEIQQNFTENKDRESGVDK